MKKIHILFILINFCIDGAFAQVKFNINGNYNNSGVWDIKQTFDLGYILTGEGYLLKTNVNGDTVWTRGYLYAGGSSVSQTNDSGYISVGDIVIKSSSSGDTLWSKLYSGLSCIFGRETFDKGYMFAGTVNNLGAGGDDIFLIKTDSAGNPIWSKTYGGTGYDEFSSLQQSSDSGYIIVGSTSSFSGGAYLIKINTNGDTLWSKTYNGAGFNSVQQTYDGGYIMVGAIGPVATDNVYLVKIDSVGNLQWSKSYGNGTFSCYGSAVHQTVDSGYIIAGPIDYTNYDGILIMKTDRNGNLVWNNSWTTANDGDEIFAVPMQLTNDGGCIIGVDLTSKYYGSRFVLIKTDSSGQSCGGGYNNPLLNAQSTSTIISDAATLVSTISPVTTSFADTIRTTGIIMGGCVINAIEESRVQSPITIFPNPVSPDGCISINLNDNLNGVELTIFNIMGEVLYSQVANGTGQTILLSLKGRLSTGMYFLRIKQGENVCVQKIVVMG